MKIPKEIPYEKLTDEEKQIKNAGGIVTEETRKKANVLLEVIKYYNIHNNQDEIRDNIIQILKLVENRFKKLSNK